MSKNDKEIKEWRIILKKAGKLVGHESDAEIPNLYKKYLKTI